MFQTFKNAWKVPELRAKLLFTVMIILLYRIGANLYVPYVNVNTISQFTEMLGSDSIFAFVSLLSGDAFAQATLFALSVSPYITASIVMQLLTIAIPALEKLSKQGDEGKKKITKYTRWVTVGLALVTAYGYVKLLESNGMLLLDKTTDPVKYYFGMAVMVACFCAGAAIIMWLAEQINERGIGNGISIILFANIISRGAAMVQQLISMVTGMGAQFDGKWWGYALGVVEVVASLALAVAAIGFIVWFTNSERRIPIQYAKRVVGRKMYGGQSSNLPLKMNMAGVMPVIFASSIVSIPATIAGFFPSSGFAKWVTEWFSFDSIFYIVLFIGLILAFSYFYIMISFNPIEVANNIRNQGGSVPGIRPGKPTSDYIKKILNRVTLMGALFLIVIAGVPMIANAIFTTFSINFSSLAFSGTSLLIIVGVALEVVRDIEAQLAMRNYKGFLD
ncbi:MAG: preprotein translocase subunit SecY [Clostridia bacterium]|nr:preprotein translocase subunit SecY [Clostridia bacterium]MBR2926266.1 preprotein translocase subunit SecY [Clostridia bacterium]